MSNDGATPRRPMPDTVSERVAILEVQQLRFQQDLATATMLLTRGAERLSEAAMKFAALEVQVVGSLAELRRQTESSEHTAAVDRAATRAALEEIRLKLARKSGEYKATDAAEAKHAGSVDGIVTKHAPKLILALLLTILAMATGRASAPDPAEVTKRVLQSMQEGK